MKALDLDALVREIADAVEGRLAGPPIRARRDAVCSDCTGTCAQRCGFKMADFVEAGADRIGGALGLRKTPSGVAPLIDHTLLKPDATRDDVLKLCDEALAHGFASVCINPVWVETCRRRLEGSEVRTCTVIGFPLGATLSQVKAFEARRAQDLGAQELDMVIQVGQLKSGLHDAVEDDIRVVVESRDAGHLVKVILETCLLTDDEKRTACRLAVKAGADYVKTSTGFSTGGATAADIVLMRAEVGPAMGVKASGGVRDLAGLQALVAAGATRIGASAGVRIAHEAEG